MNFQNLLFDLSGGGEGGAVDSVMCQSYIAWYYFFFYSTLCFCLNFLLNFQLFHKTFILVVFSNSWLRSKPLGLIMHVFIEFWRLIA